MLFFTVAINFEDRMVTFAASMPDMAKINWTGLNWARSGTRPSLEVAVELETAATVFPRR